jgi:hypothetical protein
LFGNGIDGNFSSLGAPSTTTVATQGYWRGSISIVHVPSCCPITRACGA